MKTTIIAVLLLLLVAPRQPLHAEEPLTWLQCVSEAKQAHPDLYSALAALQQAEADKRITGGQLLPQVSASLSGGQSGSTRKNTGSASAFSYSLTARQLLYDGRKTSKQVAAYGESVKAARHSYQEVSAAVRYALRSSFIDLLKAQELAGLTRDIADRRKRNMRMINLRYQAGREHIGSLRKAEADLAQSEFEVSRAERGLVLAQSGLASALGRNLRSPIRVKGSFTAEETAHSKPDFVLLAKGNPQMQRLEAERQAAGHDLEAARGAFSPELYLTSSVGKNSFDRWPPDELDWNAGVEVSLPIYGGGTGRAKEAKAMAVVSQRNAEQMSGYLKVLDALEESWKNYMDARQYVSVQKKYLDADIERASISGAQYSNGLISFDDWVIIEDNLVNAKKQFLDAGADLLIAEAVWIQAKGGGLDDR
ncbi:MAG: TolC family protein [Chlorobi bacterium]|nr:TolC family protein [Chlorobiota bacterium]